MKRIGIVCLVTFAIAFGADGQQMLTITGKVINNETRQPLPYASVLIRNTTIGTMANAEGKFMLRVPQKDVNLILQISMLGFQNAEFPLSEMQVEQVIRLKTAVTRLEQVVVQDLSAKEILWRAQQFKRKNYPSQPFQLEGYYREVQRANGKGVSLIEAFTLVDDMGYQENTPQRIFVQELRIAEAYVNPVAPFWNVKNLLVAFMNQNFVKSNRSFKHYKVTRKDDTYIDSVLVYVLEVDKRYSLWPSQIYIRSDDYAIIRTEENFNAANDGVRKWKVDDNPMMESYPQKKTLQINYRKIDGLYWPDNYRLYFRNIYKDLLQKKEVLTFEIMQQFVVTRLRSPAERVVVNSKQAQSDNVSLKHVQVPFNKLFWDQSPIRDTPADSVIRLDLIVN